MRLGCVHRTPISVDLATILLCVLLLVLHGFAHLGLDQVLADLVDVDLR